MEAVFLFFMISNIICIVFLAVLWRQNHHRYLGFRFWIVDYVLQFIALVLFTLRGVIPDILSITVSNALVISGTILFYVGLEHFTGYRSSQLHNYLMLAAFIPVHAFLVRDPTNHTIHEILFALVLLAVSIQCVWLLLRRVDPEMHVITRTVRYAFAGYCIISVISIGLELVAPAGSEIQRAEVYDSLLLFTYQVLLIVLAFSLVSVVNRRLFTDLEKDMNARQLAESALRLSEEKFHKAFQSSPDGVIISRLSDGHYVEVNEGFCRLLGYTREEMLASSSLSLGLWADPSDREIVADELRKHRRVRDQEYDFFTRSGARIHSLFSCEIIDLEGEPHILSIVRDITERKQAEKIIHLRLRLWEFAATHSISQLMQEALDEVEELTGSQIGFYHIVEGDQNTLSLQAWSTNTLAKFCHSDMPGMHYPIADAGVWVDCVSQRKPVIHNDYASLPHRKGLPPGHGTVVREVVVPTYHNDRVVSILGVGNKPTDYDQQDVDLIDYIAGLVWGIVEQKRADEQIRELNARLEYLAMTDELTSLTNRRSFISQGIKEIGRARRYQVPFSIFILDLDGFKEINDRDGHEAGDKALVCVAAVLLENIRKTDVLARLGGDEFSVLLPETTSTDALNLAERLRQAIENTHGLDHDKNLGLSASIGVASYRPDIADFDALLRLADTAMYMAKNQGGNRVVNLE